MLQPHELRTFRKQLLGWFRQSQRDLPWRRTKDPYRIWLSEIMLQQTRVAAVIPYYERFLERFPDVNALAAAPQEEVLRLWSGLGYYSRARNLQHAAQQIVVKHGGVFPRDEAEALRLPGVGRYTAAAILSIAYGAKHAVLDGNVARVLARIFAVRGNLRAKRWQGLQTQANALLDPKSPGDWNQAMMELGATLCTPRAPQCLLCPVAQFCRARELGLAESLPAARKKRATVEITLASAVLLDPGGRTLLLPPPQSSETHPSQSEVSVLVSKMWHFPTIAVATNAAAELCGFVTQLLRGLPKTTPFVLQPVATVHHAVTYRAITIHAFQVQVTRLQRVPGTKLVSLSELSTHSSAAISNLTRKIARAAVAKSAATTAAQTEALSFAQP